MTNENAAVVTATVTFLFGALLGVLVGLDLGASIAYRKVCPELLAIQTTLSDSLDTVIYHKRCVWWNEETQ